MYYYHNVKCYAKFEGNVGLRSNFTLIIGIKLIGKFQFLKFDTNGFTQKIGCKKNVVMATLEVLSLP